MPAGWICLSSTDLPLAGLTETFSRRRAQHPDGHRAVLARMRAEHGVRLMVLAPGDGVELGLRHGAHEVSSKSRVIPATGIGNQSGRLSSSYWSS